MRRLLRQPLFLTLRNPVDYTNKFKTCRWSGLRAARVRRRNASALFLPGAPQLKGGLFCQSALINRGNAAAPRRTDSDRA
jgi:hypothetical protein